MKFVFCALVLASLFALAGCSPPPQISGTVTLDGQPLPEGYIAFVPDGTGPHASGTGSGANIVNGSYLLRAPQGKYLVEITASKLLPLPPGQKGMDGATEEVRQYLPDRYNSKTELKQEITATAKIDFELKS